MQNWQVGSVWGECVLLKAWLAQRNAAPAWMLWSRGGLVQHCSQTTARMGRWQVPWKFLAQREDSIGGRKRGGSCKQAAHLKPLHIRLCDRAGGCRKGNQATYSPQAGDRAGMQIAGYHAPRTHHPAHASPYQLAEIVCAAATADMGHYTG